MSVRIQLADRKPTADDLQHVGCGRLLLQRLSRSRSCLHFSNRRTFSIAITAWSAKVDTRSTWRCENETGSGAPERKRADHFAVAHQRHAEHRPDVADARLLLFCIFWVGPGVDDLDCPVFQRHALPAFHDLRAISAARSWWRYAGSTSHPAGGIIGRSLHGGGKSHHKSPSHKRNAVAISVSSTVSRSNADRLMAFEHISSRGLLHKGFGEVAGARLHFIEQARVFDRNHRLIGEGRTSSICARTESALALVRAMTRTPSTRSLRSRRTSSIARSFCLSSFAGSV